MPAAIRLIIRDEPVVRRVMFAIEFLDPVTRLSVGSWLRPTVKGLAPPLLNRSGRFVWRLDDPPVKRDIHVDLEIDNKMYGPPVEALDFEIEANDGTVAPLKLLKRFVLTTTTLYRPPAGMTGAVGRVLLGGGSDDPMAGVSVTIVLSHDSGEDTFTSTHVAVTDRHGEFAAALSGLTRENPDPHPDDDAAIDAWLMLRNGNVSVGHYPVPLLRHGRLAYLTAPVKWTPDPP